MSKPLHTAQEYWDVRSDLFANYYKKPSLFDRIFRKGVYARTAVTLNVVKGYEKPTILDIGSGPGLNSVMWLKNSPGSTLFGIDFAKTMVDYAEAATRAEGVGDRAKFVVGDFMTYDFGGQNYDVSAAMGVFDYIQGAEAFIKRMASVTNKAMVISWPENGLRMALRRYRYTCPVYHYSEEDIRRLHTAAGVTDLEVIKLPGGWATVGRLKRA
jgi:SAM-dependent methyltransferase